MKIYNLLLVFVILFSLTFVNADIIYTNSIGIENDTVYYHSVYTVDDTNANNVSTGTPTNILIHFYVNTLPYFSIDYCNISIQKTTVLFNNSYVLQPDNYNYNSLNTGLGVVKDLSYSLYGTDSLLFQSSCHYTNINDYKSFNRYPILQIAKTSSFSCNECTQNLGEVYNSSLSFNPYSNYDKIQNLLNYDYQFWLIVEWIIKICFVFGIIGILFFGGYYLYKFIKNLEGSIR